MWITTNCGKFFKRWEYQTTLPVSCTMSWTSVHSSSGPLSIRSRNQIDYILCRQGWRSSIQSAKARLGADCGSDHELLIAKFRLKLKKVGKTTKPFRHDLNQIPYEYTVEVRNRFKGLDFLTAPPLLATVWIPYLEFREGYNGWSLAYKKWKTERLPFLGAP